MKSNVSFSEKQQFRQWWIWLIVVGLNGLGIWAIVQQLILGEPFGQNPMSNTGVFVNELIIIAVSILFMYLRLETEIDETGIKIRFFPVLFRQRHFLWSDLHQVYVRKYSALAEYGGWGFRVRIFGNGRAYNVSGNQGLQLVFNNGKKILIGTQKPEELNNILAALGRKTE